MSCQRPLTLALVRTFSHDVWKETTGGVGACGRGLPNGKTYHSGWIFPNRRPYYFEYSTSVASRVEFSGMVRPSPASVLLFPTVRIALSRSVRPH